MSIETYFRAETIELDGYSLTFDPALSLPVLLDNETNLYWLKSDVMGIDIFAETIDALRDALRAEIDMLWREYAYAKDSTLSPRALELKYVLIRRVARCEPHSIHPRLCVGR